MPTSGSPGGAVRRPLRLVAAQPPSQVYDVAANVAAHAAAVRASDARVVVFPELSLTGYCLDAASIGPDDPRLEPLVEACAASGALALVGAPVDGRAGRSHIGMLAVEASGVRLVYRKLWLAASEAERFTPGQQPAALTVDGWRLGLAICKDTGVVQHAADTAALGIDAYVAGTLMFADEVDVQNERAARIARVQHVWVAVASFAGSTGGGYQRAAGCSGIWAPGGRQVARTGPAPGGLACATLTC